MNPLKAGKYMDSKENTLPFLVVLLVIFGTLLEFGAGMWDTASHITTKPESFWTLQHVIVYSGVGMIASSAALGFIVCIKKSTTVSFRRGITIICIGAIIQISSGYVDSIMHKIYGVDGLVTSSHLALEFGYFLTSLGGFLLLLLMEKKKVRKIVPFSIITLILSVFWVVFNLSLLGGATILCEPIYEMFSAGCAIQ